MRHQFNRSRNNLPHHTTQTETAEEVAIALATTTSEDSITVLTNSQAACLSYLQGRISKTALRIPKT